MKLKIGDKVRAIDNHPYLKITRRHVGKVSGIGGNNATEISVYFKNLTKVIIFQKSELRKK